MSPSLPVRPRRSQSQACVFLQPSWLQLWEEKHLLPVFTPGTLPWRMATKPGPLKPESGRILTSLRAAQRSPWWPSAFISDLSLAAWGSLEACSLWESSTSRLSAALHSESGAYLGILLISTLPGGFAGPPSEQAGLSGRAPSRPLPPPHWMPAAPSLASLALRS